MATTTTCSLSTEDFNDVAIACQSISYAWDKLAIHLDISRTAVLSIEKGGQSSTISCMDKLLVVWLRQPSSNRPKPSWKELCEAIANLDRPLSRKIWSDHIKGCGMCSRDDSSTNSANISQQSLKHDKEEPTSSDTEWVSGLEQTDHPNAHQHGTIDADVHMLKQRIKSLESQLVTLKQMMMELDTTRDELKQTQQHLNMLQEELIDRNSKIKKDDLDAELLKAVDYGHVKRIEILIKSGASVNTTSKHWHRTPLHQASSNGHLEAVNVLISLGAGVDTNDDTGDTPLLVASSRGHHQIVTVLLSRGATVNQKNKVESTPLHEASLNGHIDVVNVLLSHGATVNEENDKGNTPLHCASMYDHTDVVQVLLSHGAVVNSMNEDCQTPLHQKCLTMGRSRNVTATAELLISHGADLYSEDKYGNSPVLLATVFGYEDLMLSHGVSEDIISKHRLPKGWKANKDYDHRYIEYINSQNGAKQIDHPSVNGSLSLSGLAGYLYEYISSFNRT